MLHRTRGPLPRAEKGSVRVLSLSLYSTLSSLSLLLEALLLLLLLLMAMMMKSDGGDNDEG